MTNVLDDLDRAYPAGPTLPEGWLDPSERHPGALDQTMQPFGSSRMLPAAAYTSPQVLAWEKRYLFAGTWTCVGRDEDLRAPAADERPATQRAIVVGDVPVMLTWEGDDIHAFANTCRHRAHEMLPEGETNNTRFVVCPYHAWSYKLDGSLKNAPMYRGLEGFDEEEYGLIELPVERWQGWVFVHAANSIADGGAPVSFKDHIGDMAGMIEPYQVDKLKLAARHSYEVNANWKVITENYHECYHCPSIHPELCEVTPPTSGDNYALPGAWVGGSMVLRDEMATMSITGKSEGVMLEGVSPTHVYYLGLWPNLLISPHPDYVLAHRMIPLAPDRTWVECSWYMPAEHPDGTPVDPSYAEEFWDITNKQDWSACESVQRGLSSPHFSPGPFSPSEDAVHQFTTMVGRGYRGEPMHLQLPLSEA
jgi:Rieske 2Fe-2S family protein